MAGQSNHDHIKSAIDLTERRPPSDWLISPFRRFAGLGAAGGILLILCALAAMLWANFAPDSYDHILHADIAIRVGGFVLDQGLLHWIDDVLMSVFFLLVGLEIKREVISGELASIRQAALPLLAALGGMLVPAGIYATTSAIASASGAEGIAWHGWGIPMATDIAFALGIMALLGPRVPISLRVFLSTLAVADDLGALIVIAVFYTENLDFLAMAYAAAVYAALVLCALLKVREPIIYVLLGLILLYFMSESGVHATIAGVLVASTIPVSPRVNIPAYLRSSRTALNLIEQDEREHGHERPAGELTPTQMVAARVVAMNSRHIRPPLHRLEHALGPWVAFLILPVFALSNAGVDLSSIEPRHAVGPLGIGIFLGLLIGKPLGIVAACWIAVRLGIANLPRGTNWAQIIGVGFLGGIGFTMAVFIANLAFEGSPEQADIAKLAILIASVVASIAGVAILWRAGRRAVQTPSPAFDPSVDKLKQELGSVDEDPSD